MARHSCVVRVFYIKKVVLPCIVTVDKLLKTIINLGISFVREAFRVQFTCTTPPKPTLASNLKPTLDPDLEYTRHDDFPKLRRGKLILCARKYMNPLRFYVSIIKCKFINITCQDVINVYLYFFKFGIYIIVYQHMMIIILKCSLFYFSK